MTRGARLSDPVVALDPATMARLDGLEAGLATGWDPATQA
jgi:hypothetical protein